MSHRLLLLVHLFTSYLVGIDPDRDGNHRKYINKLCDDFEETMKTLISSAVEKKPTTQRKDDLFVEVSQHAFLCQAMCNSFRGRTQTLDVSVCLLNFVFVTLLEI